MRILAVGDVCGPGGLDVLERKLRGLRRLEELEFVVVNGENASGVGITPKQALRTPLPLATIPLTSGPSAIFWTTALPLSGP